MRIKLKLKKKRREVPNGCCEIIHSFPADGETPIKQVNYSKKKLIKKLISM